MTPENRVRPPRTPWIRLSDLSKLSEKARQHPGPCAGTCVFSRLLMDWCEPDTIPHGSLPTPYCVRPLRYKTGQHLQESARLYTIVHLRDEVARCRSPWQIAALQPSESRFHEHTYQDARRDRKDA